MWKKKLVWHLLRIMAIAVFGGLLSATLMRVAPGFEVDEQQLDSRLSAESLQALHTARAQNRNPFQFYVRYLGSALHGDLGTSSTFNRPIRQLISERLPVTLQLIGSGLVLGWAIACVMAVIASLWRSIAYEIGASIIAGTLLCIPAAVLALALVFFRAPGYLAIAFIVLPKVFSYVHGLLRRNYSLPHILTAYAKGNGPTRILLRHLVPVSAPELLALGAVSVSYALGAAIPVEALCGIPGIGHLAWQAALNRDLPLLVNVTLIVTVMTLAANSGSDLLSDRWGGHFV